MKEFQAQLARLLRKEIDIETVEASLRQTLQQDPASAAPISELLNQLFRSSRLPAKVYITLKQHLPEEGAPPASPPPPTQGAGPATGPAATGPGTGTPGPGGTSPPPSFTPTPGEPPLTAYPDGSAPQSPPPADESAAAGGPAAGDESGSSDILDILGQPGGDAPTGPGFPSAPPPEDEPEPSSDRTVFRAPGDEEGEEKPSEDKTVFKQAAPQMQPSSQHSAPASTGTGANHSQPTGMTGPSGPTGAYTGTGSNWTDPSKWGEGPARVMQPGVVLKDKYVLESVIGRGGMGVVFKARDLRREEAQDRNPHVAVKILNDEFRRHPESVMALQRESRKAQDLAHPNIVNVFDFDRDGTTVYMVMELLEGQSLDHVTKGKSFDGMPMEEAFPLIEGLSLALSYAHRKGIVHSDFKPGNCFVTRDDVIKVFDFGIARAAKIQGDLSGDETKFDPGQLGALTPAYASLEMLEGEEPDPRDDIYALACVAYEMLIGRHPFDKYPADKARDKKMKPAPIKGLTRRQQRALQNGLAFTRDKRAPSVDEFLEDLRPRELKKAPIAIAAAVAVAVVAGGVILVPDIMANRKIDGMIYQIVGAPDSSIRDLLVELESFPEEQRDEVLSDGSVEERIITYFDGAIEAAQGEYDYPTAETLTAEALAIYGDSNRLNNARDDVEETKAQLLAELDRRFNENLDAGRLLPSDGEDIQDVIDLIEKIDPANALLADQRLAIAYATRATAVIESDPLAARTLIAAGQQRFPQDPALSSLADRLTTILETQDRELRVAELEQSLNAALASLNSLDAVLAIERDLLDLEALDAGNALGVRVQDRVQQLINAGVEAELAGNNWSAAGNVVNRYGRAVSPEYRAAINQRIDDAETRYTERVGTVYANIIDAAQKGDFAGAERAIADLEQQGADAATLAEARGAVSQGYLDRARAQRGEEDFDAARETVAAGRSFDPAFAGWDAELSSISQAETRKLEGEAESARQERLARVQRLSDDIDNSLDQAQFGIAEAEATLALINELAEVDPGNARARTGRSDVASKLAVEIQVMSTQDTRLGEARELVAAAERLLPGEQVLRDAGRKVEERQDMLRAERAAEELQNTKNELESLVAAASFDAAWDSGLRRAIQGIEPAPGQADYVAGKRREIATMYIEQAESVLAENRFDRAEQLLDASEWFATGVGNVASIREDLTAARSAFEAENRERQRLASIQGLKNTFQTSLAAERIIEAKDARDKLANLLPANDAFLRDEAPAAIADTYLKLATRALAEERFDNAESLAREGLKEVSSNSQLTDLLANISELRLETNVARAREMLQNSAPDDVAGARRILDAIKQDAGAEYVDFEAEFREIAEQRVADNRSQRDELTDWYTQIFGAFEPPALAGPPCTPNMAGYGNRTQGRCYDILPDSKTRGPSLVVVQGGGSAFAIGQQEVSIRDWNAYCEISGTCSPRSGDDSLPVTNIAVSDVIAYADWLSQSTNKTYRLPTEQEWLVAASAEGRRKASPNCRNPQAGTGDSLLAVNWGSTNDYGLKNYVGNALEWVVAGPGSYVARGGAFRDSLGSCKVDLARPHPGNPDATVGFRLVRELDGGTG